MVWKAVNKRRTLATLFLACLLNLHSTAGIAQAIGSCTIMVQAPGLMTVGTDLTNLSTRNAGGYPAKVTVQTTFSGVIPSLLCRADLLRNCFRLSTQPVTDFLSSPAASDRDAAFTSGMRRVGEAASLNALSIVLLDGTHEFVVDMSVQKSAGVFSAGSYEAQQTLTCE
ncbi:hypothetical protein FP2506_00935 [Fulvimarina pelagi HTCC2506]|uniref:Uncharacterized protein n=1 Tax=Fulvimarina pelagi HTCC2506 TaxID=314231 RepID=Q0G2B0_9HYPH|nr:hypothetical protein [Fulvimarina pelagi]EAU41288.1 hypothetical protein FP2506_00935 [Fulvimarina pelagi HTCC2506]